MAKKKKFYVIWEGHQIGVFDSWDTCKGLIKNYPGAKYKSFPSRAEAEEAFSSSYEAYVGVDTSKKKITKEALEKVGEPIYPSLAVDAACCGNPGKMEYRGVDAQSKKQIFIQGPFDDGTNNVGEFLALVHGLAFLKKQGKETLPIYSDSKIAISWVRQKKCKTKLAKTYKNKELHVLIARAEKWLHENTYKTPILKWQTKYWGEIPADFGRK